jgi:hypothetical protein
LLCRAIVPHGIVYDGVCSGMGSDRLTLYHLLPISWGLCSQAPTLHAPLLMCVSLCASVCVCVRMQAYGQQQGYGGEYYGHQQGHGQQQQQQQPQ